MSSTKFVILGGGMVAGYAAKELVNGGLKSGELTIVSADTALPYERPPLSKNFLSGKDTEAAVLINPPDFYRDHGIQVKLQTTIEKMDFENKLLHATSGEEFEYEKLLLATGARARRLDYPGSQLRNVLYLRSLDDSKNIRSIAESAKEVVIIGGGFIGMEVASVLAQKKVQTTIVIRDDRVMNRVFTPEMSVFFENYYSSRGVRLVKQATVKSLVGNEAVRSVVLADGRSIPCNLVIAGIGAIPVTELFANSGLTLDNGVVVNEYLETSQPGVYAAGDMASYPDSIFGKRRRVEHWDNAVSQGQHCARALLGERRPFVHVPYFFSDVFDLSYELWGDAEGATQTVVRGDLSSPSFSVWWLKQNRLVAVFVMSRPEDEREAAAEWIRSGQIVSPERLADQARSLREAV